MVTKRHLKIKISSEVRYIVKDSRVAVLDAVMWALPLKPSGILQPVMK